MAEFLDLDGFRRLFDDSAIVFTNLPQGHARELAEQTNDRAGRGDATLRTRAEFDTLFVDLSGGAETLEVRDDQGELTPEGTIVDQLQQVAIGAGTFFGHPLHVVSITDWSSGDALLEEPVTASGSARIRFGEPIKPIRDTYRLPDLRGVLTTAAPIAFAQRDERQFARSARPPDAVPPTNHAQPKICGLVLWLQINCGQNLDI